MSFFTLASCSESKEDLEPNSGMSGQFGKDPVAAQELIGFVVDKHGPRTQGKFLSIPLKVKPNMEI